MKKTAKQQKRPTYAELERKLHNLRHKVRLLQADWRGRSAHLELANACGITGAQSRKERDHEAGILFHCASIDLAYVLQGED